MYTSFRLEHGLGYMTVPEMLETMHENDLFDMSPVFSNVVHICGVVPATCCCAERSFSALCRLKTYRSAAPWDNNESVTSSVTWSYHWYLRPSKWQRQHLLLTCFMSSNCPYAYVLTVSTASVFKSPTDTALEILNRKLTHLCSYFHLVRRINQSFGKPDVMQYRR